MDIGITGETGFVGRAVWRHLADQGHRVLSLRSWTYGWAPGGPPAAPGDKPANLDWVLHLGARTDIADSWERPTATYANNVGSTLAALDIARGAGASLVYMSSYVYGVPQYLPIDERHPTDAVNPYMGSKLLGEQLCRQWHDFLDLPLVVLRCFNIYGDHERSDRLVPALLTLARTGARLEIDDPEPRRDYLYIKDFVRLIQRIVEADPVPSGTYNVGGGEAISNREVAETVRRLVNEERSVHYAGRPRRNDIAECRADATKVREAFDWRPEYGLERGLAEILGCAR